MKKVFFFFPVLIMCYFIMTGQKSPDVPEKWNINPEMTRMYTSGQYAPLPQNDNIVFSTEKRFVPTPIGVFGISPNFRVHPSTGTQSEVPITRHPLNPLIMLGSANTFRGGSTFSTGVYVTTNGGVNWFGSDTLNNGGFNSGDPGPMIDKDGRFLMSYITTSFSMGASYSTNNGINWAPTITFPGATTSADKNLSGTDDAPTSAFYGRSYTVYTEFGGSFVNRIVLSYTTNGGVSWSSVAPVSPPTSPGHHHQGCDVRVGPNGEVYVVWANCTTNGQNSTEDSLGFAKSTDGGVTWAVARNNASNMNGIRASNLLNGIRAAGFPRIDVDRSGGPRNGWIYVATAEKSVAPATDGSDAILHRSTDGGTTWTSVRVNQDTPGNGKFQYMSAIRVDESGGLNVIYYDTRNTPSNDSAQVYVSRSLDGGTTWTDILVSDHKFRPKPISGLAGGYQGDYIGITSGLGKAWPYWADDITGIYQAWTTEVEIVTFPLNAYNLNTPSPGTRIVSFPNSSTPSNFTWDTSASTASYKWIFGSPTTSPRKITLATTGNQLTITAGQLDNILAGLGLLPGDSLVGQWDVWAFRNNQENDSLKSANGPRSITLKRGVPALTSFNLLSPPSGTTITTSVFNNTPININWSRSGAGVTYKWKFGNPTISTVRLSLPSNNSGYDSTLSLINSSLDGTLAGLGLNPGDSLVGQWAVWAYSGIDSLRSTQIFALTLKRQAKGDVVIVYDSTVTACRTSRDSIANNLGAMGITYDLFNRKGNTTGTTSISYRGYKKVIVLGEGTSVMSNVIKDSLKSYIASGTGSVKAKLILMAEDVGYHLDRSASTYVDTAFARGTLGFQFVLDRPTSGANQGLIGVTTNPGMADSTSGPWPDVMQRPAGTPSSQSFRLYRFRAYPDSSNGLGRITTTYNTAIMGIDIESLKPTADSPPGSPVRRFLKGALDFVDGFLVSVQPSTVDGLPTEYSLAQNYPNPFNPATKISFSIPKQGLVTLKIYDVLGKEVMTLVNEQKNIGNYEVTFDGSNLSSGAYFYRIEAGEFMNIKRMILIK